MVEQVFSVISQACTQFVSVLSSSVTSLTNLFYNTETGMTFLGTMLLIAVGIAIIYWVFRLIRGVVSGVAR